MRIGHFNLIAFKKDESGSFAVILALLSMVLLIGIGAAIDLNRLSAMKMSTQDSVDNATLAAARSMTMTAVTTNSLGARKSEAQDIATTMVELHLAQRPEITLVQPSVYFPQNKSVKVEVKATLKPVLMHMFGYDKLSVTAVAEVDIGEMQDTDIDVALIADATHSMVDTLSAIQQNMQDFTSDLNNILQSRNIEAGTVRVKFVFFRDYMIDNHTAWTGRTMTPNPAIPNWGPMYTSQFYELPSEKADMDNYVNSFRANGGGQDQRESALEALSYTLDDSNWKSGSNTVRAIVLWTDAPPRAFNDKEEAFLAPGAAPYWEQWLPINVGSAITAMSKSQREKFMVDNYYPADVPTTTEQLKAIYDAFHTENSNGFEGVNTMTINILDDCQNRNPCGEWPDIAQWKGVDYHYDTGTNTVSETYQKILDQVADTVQKQLVSKDLAIKY